MVARLRDRARLRCARSGTCRSDRRPPPTADPVLGHYEDGDMVFEWHMDTFELPDGATLLATGDDVANQAFRLGDRTWATQFHFEIDRPEMDLWLDEVADDRRGTLGEVPRRAPSGGRPVSGSARARGRRGVPPVREGHAGAVVTYRPLIAVVAYHLDGDAGRALARRRLRRAGSLHRGAPARGRAHGDRVARRDRATPTRSSSSFDGLLLVGGGDVDPARYGAEPRRGAQLRRRDRPGWVRDRAAARGRRTASADALHLPGHAGHERRLRRHAASASAGHGGTRRARRSARGHRDDARG